MSLLCCEVSELFASLHLTWRNVPAQCDQVCSTHTCLSSVVLVCMSGFFAFSAENAGLHGRRIFAVPVLLLIWFVSGSVHHLCVRCSDFVSVCSRLLCPFWASMRATVHITPCSSIWMWQRCVNSSRTSCGGN